MATTATNPGIGYRRGPHWVAVVAACLTWPLLISGARVTTNRVGMAVPDWPTTFGINMFLYNMFDAPWGVYIEHSHRLFGSAVGVAAILLATWLAVSERRRWMRFMGIAALGAVILQGLIGGTRVLKNSTYYAAIHGCTGQLVFALLVAVGVFTSRDWIEAKYGESDPDHLRRRSLVTVMLVYAQIVAGALLRHFGAGLVVHAVLAAAVWGHVVWLFLRVERCREVVPSLVGPARAMASLVTLQILLGFGAWWMLRPPGALTAADRTQGEILAYVWWVFRPFDGIARPVTNPQALMRSGHVVNGALLLAASVILTLRSFRHLASPERSVSRVLSTLDRATEAIV